MQGAEILVVDDNGVNLLVAGEMLQSFGVQVTYATNAADAFHHCEVQVYDLIFMDHLMPGMDGMEATAKLRQQPGPNQKTPIVALTANVMGDMKKQYLACGMNDFIGKPIEFPELARILRKWVPEEKILETPC